MRVMARSTHDDLTRLGVLDNDSLALGMLTVLFARHKEMQVLWMERSAASAIQRCMYPPTRPDVILVDIGLEGISGIEVGRRITQFGMSIRLIGITAYTPTAYEREAVSAGMEEVIAKEDFPTIINIINRTAAVHDHVSRYKYTEQSPGLSPRELEVMRYYANGKTTREIMGLLNLSKGTLSSYETRAIHKLDVRNRMEAVALCASMHLFG